MASWLSRATSLFQQAPPPIETFEVECDCGGKVVGQRTSSYQKRPCPLCQRPVFVLPANVYPQPKLRPDLRKQTTAAIPTRSGSATVVDETPPPAAATTTASTTSSSVAGRKAQSPRVVEPAIFQERRRPLMTPLRWLAAAILVMSSLTVGGLWHRHRVESAKATVSQAADAGIAAIRENDFVKAAQELRRAQLAVDVIGRTDPAANEIRRLSREATAMAKLASSTLEEFVRETLANAKSDQTEPLRLSSVDKGAWIIFDARLILDVEGQEYTVDFPMMLEDGLVRIEIASAAFRDLPRLDESGEASRVIFAAQLEQLSPPQGEPPTVVLTLNGKTAFLWSSYDNYAAIGYRPFDEESERQTRVVLERQLEAQQK